MDGPKGHGLFGQYVAKPSASQEVYQAFEAFLEKEINIARGTRGEASTSHNHLREFLVDESDRDESFPRILRDVDTDFLGGSFARHTKIWPLDDIDIYVPLDGGGLVYTQGDVQLPYDVLSDDGTLENPLLGPASRWMTGSYISSRKLIDGFVKVLDRHYPKQTKVRSDGSAVNVQMSDLGFDVVPGFSLRPQNRNEQGFYLIPDGHDNWIRTNPRIDADISSNLQKNNHSTHRRAVKLLKWWNNNHLNGRLDSYYIELAVMQSLAAANQSGVTHSTISEAVTHGFDAVNQVVRRGDLQFWVPGAPPVESGTLSYDDPQKLAGAALDSSVALSREQVGDSKRALEMWQRVFGPEFIVE